MVKKIKIETTPTPTPTESEEEKEEVDVVEYSKQSIPTKKKTLDIDDIKSSVLSLVQGAIKQRDESKQSKPKQKRQVSEAVLKRLELAREKRRVNHEEQKEYKAKQLLEQKGYKLSKFETKAVEVEKSNPSRPLPKVMDVTSTKGEGEVKKQVSVKIESNIQSEPKNKFYQPTLSNIPLKSSKTTKTPIKNQNPFLEL